MKNLTPHEVVAREQVQALLDSHKINWGQLLQLLGPVLNQLLPILVGLAGSGTGGATGGTPPTPAP